MKREQIMDHASSYIDFCGSDLSVATFATWCRMHDFTKKQEQQIFLCAIAIIMDSK